MTATAATTTYVTAFIDVPTIDGGAPTRRTATDYKRVAQELLEQDIPLIFFGDPTMAEHVRTVRASHLASKTHIIPLRYEELPTYKYLQAIEAAIVQNGIFGAPSCQRYTPTYLTTILAKPLLLENATRINPFNTTHFCWHDFGFYHLKPTYWPAFDKIDPSLYTEINHAWSTTQDRLKICLVSPFEHLLADPSVEHLCSRDHNIVAGAFFGGNSTAITRTATKYTYQLESLLAVGRIVNEEILLGKLFVETPAEYDINACYYTTCVPSFASTRSGPERLMLHLPTTQRLGWHENTIQLAWKALAGLQQGYVTYPPEQLHQLFIAYLAALRALGRTEEAKYVAWEAHFRGVIPMEDTSILPPWGRTPNADSYYGDIRRIPTPFTLADLLRIATETPACVGFTTTGWLKHTLQSTHRHTTEADLYTTLLPRLEITDL